MFEDDEDDDDVCKGRIKEQIGSGDFSQIEAKSPNTICISICWL